jgi:hypothetical protein
MIVFQSPAIVERPNDRPCYSPSPRGEGELSHRGRQSAPIWPRTAAVPFQINFSHSGQVSASSVTLWQKSVSISVHPWFNFPPFPSEISTLSKAAQTLSKPAKGPGEGGGGGQPGRFNEGFIAPICTQLRLFAHFFRKKKIVYFFAPALLAFGSSLRIKPNQPLLVQIQTKYRPIPAKKHEPALFKSRRPMRLVCLLK